MENVQTYRTDTLMGELQDWNRLEKMFSETFGEASLKDREFLKMKLSEFNKLYNKYDDTKLTSDNRGMHRMLQFQKNKLEKNLYPNLLVRWYFRGVHALKGLLVKTGTGRAVEKLYAAPQYHSVTITAQDKRGEERQDNTRQNTPQQRYGQNPGRRDWKAKDRSKSHRV